MSAIVSFYFPLSFQLLLIRMMGTKNKVIFLHENMWLENYYFI